MQLAKLLTDVTGMTPETSQRSQHSRLADMLNQKHGAGAITLKGVAKWFERDTIPGPWLLKIAALRKPPLNLSTYA